MKPQMDFLSLVEVLSTLRLKKSPQTSWPRVQLIVPLSVNLTASRGGQSAPNNRWAVQEEKEDYPDEEALAEEPRGPAEAAAKDKEAIHQCLANLDQVVEFVKHIYNPSNVRVVILHVNDDEEGEKYILPPWADSPATGKCVFCERRKEIPNFQELPKPIKCGHHVGNMQIAAGVLTPFAEAKVDINILEVAREHTHMCKAGFALRYSMPGTEASSSSTDPRINETFGFDHKALEGFENYEESLRKVLIDEMTSLKKKTVLSEKLLFPRLSKRRNGKKAS